ncbi:MAG TPA: DUF504 domain-containing protein [Gammaproteobacteria bacterium]
MQTAQEILNKIRWDQRLATDAFVIGFYDRVENQLIKVAFKEIRFPEDHHFLFEIVDAEGELRSIPYHRVREIHQNGRLIWRRD